MSDIHDVLILGGGPAGYTAAMYCARAGLDALVVERGVPGGQAALTPWIENMPGFDEGISGPELGERLRRGAERFGARTMTAEATSILPEGAVKQVETTGGVLQGRTLILATGASPRLPGIPGEQGWLGRGLSVCAACDGPLYRGKVAAVLGGGNGAVSEALTLSRVCRRVILIHRRDHLRAEETLAARLRARDNATILWDRAVIALNGQDRLTSLTLRHLPTGALEELPCDGLFVSIGRVPESTLARGWLPLDESGAILSDGVRTSIPGVYVAGDVRAHSLHQLVAAASDGAQSGTAASESIQNHRP